MCEYRRYIDDKIARDRSLRIDDQQTKDGIKLLMQQLEAEKKASAAGRRRVTWR